MKKIVLISFPAVLAVSFSSCALITTPVKVAGKAATTTIGVAGKAASGGIGLLTSNSDDNSSDE